MVVLKETLLRLGILSNWHAIGRGKVTMTTSGRLPTLNPPGSIEVHAAGMEEGESH